MRPIFYVKVGAQQKVTSSFNFNTCIILISECHTSIKSRKWIFLLAVCLSYVLYIYFMAKKI